MKFDKRCSKETLLARIKELEDDKKLEKVFEAALNAVAHVGAANYQHREDEAKAWVLSAYYGEEISPEAARDMF